MFTSIYSAGRVHSAMVASLNYDMRTAIVEWFEQGETKGKEIDMTVIEALNPDIRIVKPGDLEIIVNESPISIPNRSPPHPLEKVSIKRMVKDESIRELETFSRKTV